MAGKTQKKLKIKTFKYFFAVLFSLIFVAGLYSCKPNAQGTTLEIENAKLTAGETVTLYLNLTEAIDGLSRLDAAIVSKNPKVLKLKNISPQAVSDQFFQIDSENKEEINFKLVDLGKSVEPGARNVQLISFEAEALKAGEAQITLTGIKYTDEDGNAIQPALKPSTVTISSPKPEKNKKTETGQKKQEETEVNEKKKTSKEEPKTEPEKKTDEEKDQQAKKTVEEKETIEKEEQNYVPKLESLKLKLGGKGEARLSVSSLPDGLRMARTTIVSDGGVELDGVAGLNPNHFEVNESSGEMINFRVGDFDDKIGPGTSSLEMAKVEIKAKQIGKVNLWIRMTVWTDKGEKVVRTKESSNLSVVVGSIGNADSPPKDLDGDGYYEDVNGDGKLTESDVFALAFNLRSKAVQNSISFFDFNGDGQITFEDAVNLMEMIEEES